MADTDQTSPADAGHTTSEFKLTTAVVVIGAVLEGAAGVLHAIQGTVAAPWIPAVLAVIGVLLQIASVLGYTQSRAAVKTALIAADAQGTAAAALTQPKTAVELINGDKK